MNDVYSRAIITKTLANLRYMLNAATAEDAADEVIKALAKEHLHIFKSKGVELP
jgi:hypothetical protein